MGHNLDRAFLRPTFPPPEEASLRFRKTVAMRRRLDRPRWSLGYVARYRPKDNPDKLVERLRRFPIGQGWYVLKDRTEIHGTFYAPDQTLRSRRQLEQLRRELKQTSLFLSLRLTSVRLSG